MPRRETVPCSVDFGSRLFEPHATCPETELAKSEIVERASAMFAFSILFSTCKAPVPQLGALSINCFPPSFRCTRNRVVSFNLTRPPKVTRVHIKEALILSASQPLSSLPQRKTNRNISLSPHVQLWLRLSNLGMLSNCGRLSGLWSMTQLQHQRSCGALRSLRVAKLQEVLGQFHDVQVTFTSQATLSKTLGLLDIS